MSRKASISYCIFVILILCVVLGYFIWEGYRLRDERIASFFTRGRQYANSLADTVDEDGGIEREVARAERIIRDDPSIVAVQVDSQRAGLRLSVVKESAKDYSQTMIAESPAFESTLNRLLYQKGSFDVESDVLEGGRISLVSTLFTRAEIRYALLVLLFAVVSLLILTLLIIVLNPGRESRRGSAGRGVAGGGGSNRGSSRDGRSQTSSSQENDERSRRGVREYSTGIGDYAEVELNDLPESRHREKWDFSLGGGGKESLGMTGAGMVAGITEQEDSIENLDESEDTFVMEIEDGLDDMELDNLRFDDGDNAGGENDSVEPARLWEGKIGAADFSEGDFAQDGSASLDNDYDDFEDLEQDSADFPEAFPVPSSNESDILDLEEDNDLLAIGSIDKAELLRRLGLEIERASSFNQDISFMMFHNGQENIQAIQEYYINHDLIFTLNDEQLVIIETDKDLDECISAAETFLRNYEKTSGGDEARKVLIGISSRNGRLINGERLFKEAWTALQKTNEQNRIVAFRSDPEKYRQYLREKISE